MDGLQSLPDPVGSSIPSDPETVARITAAVQVGGGLLLATGKLPRVASAALALTVLPANLGTHTFWNEPDPELKAQKRQQFLTDLSLVGGLLIASADTAGKPSLGWRGRRAAERLSERVSSALPGSDDAISGTSARRSCTACRSVPNAAANWPAPRPKEAHPTPKQLSNAAANWPAPPPKEARPTPKRRCKRGRELASTAADRSAPLAKKARKRSEKLAKKARKRGEKLADTARDRGSEFADTAVARGSELADAARERVGDEIKRSSSPSALLVIRAHELAERHELLGSWVSPPRSMTTPALVGTERFQSVELRPQQRGRHEMTGPGGQSAADQFR